MKFKCIYCLEDKDKGAFRKREHVLPKSFGGFQNNLTLKRIVCDDCNETLGDTIELTLGRDTFEGSLLRYKYNIKKSEDFKTFGKAGQLIIKLQETPYRGAFIYLEGFSEDDNCFLCDFCPQIGLLKYSGEYEYYLLANIPEKSDLDQSQYNFNTQDKPLIVLSCEPNYAQKLLREKGFDITELREFDIPEASSIDEVMCEIQRDIDNTLFRAIAKIGFNYLTSWKGTIFVLDKTFDPIRKFIRYDIQPDFLIKEMRIKPFFPDEKFLNKHRVGHVIVNYWDKKTNMLEACVSLFNTVQYSVSLANDEIGQYEDIKKGVFFNLENLKISELHEELLNFLF